MWNNKEKQSMNRSAEQSIENIQSEFDRLYQAIIKWTIEENAKQQRILNLNNSIYQTRMETFSLQNESIMNRLDQLSSDVENLGNRNYIELVRPKEWVKIGKWDSLDTRNLLDYLPEWATVDLIEPETLDVSEVWEHSIKIKIEYEGSSKEIDCIYTVFWATVKSNIKRPIWDQLQVEHLLDLPESATAEIKKLEDLNISEIWEKTVEIEITYADWSKETLNCNFEVVKPSSKEWILVKVWRSLEAKDLLDNLPSDASAEFVNQPDFTELWVKGVEVKITYADASTETVECSFEVVEPKAKENVKILSWDNLEASDLVDNLPYDAEASFVDVNQLDTITEWKRDIEVQIRYADDSTENITCQYEVIPHLPATPKEWVSVVRWWTLNAEDLLDNLPEWSRARFVETPNFDTLWEKNITVKVLYNPVEAVEEIQCKYEVVEDDTNTNTDDNKWNKRKEKIQDWFKKQQSWVKTQWDWLKSKEEWKNNPWKNILRALWWVGIVGWLVRLWKKIFGKKDRESRIPWYENMTRREKRQARRKWRREQREKK